MQRHKNRVEKSSAAQDWTGRKVLIIGAARQGLALAVYLVRHGAQVILNDIRPAADLAVEQASLAEQIIGHSGSLHWVCGSHPLSLVDEVNLVCISGGVPLTLPLVMKATERGVPLSNDSQDLFKCKAM